MWWLVSGGQGVGGGRGKFQAIKDSLASLHGTMGGCVGGGVHLGDYVTKQMGF